MVIGYPAGGPTDALGRVMAEAMRDLLVRIDDFPRDQQTPEAHAAFQKAEREKW
jgi:hypothetical protein